MGPSAAWSLENDITVSHRAQAASARARDAAIAQPAQSFTQTVHGSWPPAATKSAKRAKSPLTFPS